MSFLTFPPLCSLDFLIRDFLSFHHKKPEIRKSGLRNYLIVEAERFAHPFVLPELLTNSMDMVHYCG